MKEIKSNSDILRIRKLVTSFRWDFKESLKSYFIWNLMEYKIMGSFGLRPGTKLQF